MIPVNAGEMFMNIFLLIISILLSLQSDADIDYVLKIMDWEGYIPQDQIKDFEKKHNTNGIHLKIEVIHANSNDDFFTAAKEQSVDLITLTHFLINDERFKYIGRQLLVPINVSRIRNFNKMIPSLQNAKFLSKNSLIYAIPIVSGSYGIIYNKKMTQRKLDTWEVLWEPQFAGKYKITDDYPEVNIYLTALVLGVPKDNWTNYEQLDNPLFRKKLVTLAKGSKGFWSSIDTAQNLQDVWLATTWGFSLASLQQLDNGWVKAKPKEGELIWQDSMAMTLTLAHNPTLRAIAEEWIDYMISPAYQATVFMRGLQCYPVNRLTSEYASHAEIEQFHLNELDEFMSKQILIPTIKSTRDRNGITLLWKLALASL